MLVEVGRKNETFYHVLHEIYFIYLSIEVKREFKITLHFQIKTYEKAIFIF